MTKPRKRSPKTPSVTTPASKGDPHRPGLPPQSPVLRELALDSPKGNRYRVLRTSRGLTPRTETRRPRADLD